MCSSNSRFRSYRVFYLLIISTYIAHSLAHKDCESISDCDSNSESICALDKESVCFRQFHTECDMKTAVCESEKEYIVYDNEYCKLIGFMCSKEYKKYNEKYIRNEDLDSLVYSIYSESNPK